LHRRVSAILRIEPPIARFLGLSTLGYAWQRRNQRPPTEPVDCRQFNVPTLLLASDAFSQQRQDLIRLSGAVVEDCKAPCAKFARDVDLLDQLDDIGGIAPDA